MTTKPELIQGAKACVFDTYGTLLDCSAAAARHKDVLGPRCQNIGDHWLNWLKLGLDSPQEVCYVSGNGWDVAGAANFGFQTVWINRRNAPVERLPGAPSVVLPSLTPILDHLQ